MCNSISSHATAIWNMVPENRLIASKSRFSKKQLSKPRLELVAAKMVANLAKKVGKPSPNNNIRKVYGWSVSTVVLHGLQSNGSYKQFVHNRVKYVNSKTLIAWRYVNTTHNSAYVGSRESSIENLQGEW